MRMYRAKRATGDSMAPPTSKLRDTGGPRVGKRKDDGFTLIELIVVVAVMPLVVGAISVALIAVFKNETTVSGSLTASGDAQVVSANYVGDVQSAEWITTSPTIMCGTSGSQVLTLSSDNVAAAAQITDLVSYVKVNVGGSDSSYSLFRRVCQGNSPPVSSLVSHDIPSGQTATILPNSEQIAASSGWVAASGTSSVNLSITEPPTNYIYSLTAVPRTLTAPGVGPDAPFQPILPLELLGTSCPSLIMNGSGSIVTVDGGSGALGFTSTASTCPNPTSGAPPATIQAATPYVRGVPLPFQELVAPATPSPPFGAGSCNAQGTCSSGLYPSGFNFPSVATFDPSIGPNPGAVVFSGPVDFTQSTVTFEGGPDLTKETYWFQQGLTVEAHSNATFGPATYIFDPAPTGNALNIASQAAISAPLGSSGLLFYIRAGLATFAGGVSGTIAGSPVYDGIAIWDVSSGLLSMSGGTGVGATYGGIFDPNGPFEVAGGSSFSAQFLAVNSGQVSGGTTVTLTG
jgi:prepilin-type N-terminal cleavage/methylation domain-containing protein